MRRIYVSYIKILSFKITTVELNLFIQINISIKISKTYEIKKVNVCSSKN